ncbi:MAG: glycosyltransferase family 2 protein [Sphingomicrobium sp.]
MPRISVILPVHNRERCVAAAIDSVLAQNFADFELVVVDDGSSDSSAAVVAGFADPRVRLIRLARNGGGNAARNAGIRAARAPLIAFLDSDDAFLPDKLSAVVAEFERRPELDVLVDSYVVQYPDGRPEQQRRNPAIEGAAFVEALFERRLWKATPAISARTAAVVRAGLFDEELRRRQDFEFLARAARVAHCAASDRSLWIKRWSPEAISAQSGVYIDATIAVCRKHPEFFADPRFYHGLARDVARQMSRLMRGGEWRAAARDVVRLRREFGTAATVRLIRVGWREANVRKRAKAARLAASPPGAGEADRAEQSRALPRS